MRLHQNEHSAPLPVAERRVTPEEFASAMSAVQAQKEDADSHQSDTVRIGDAIQQLSLDATPEEIWAEVQARRQRLDVVGRTRTIPAKHFKLFGSSFLGVLAVMFALNCLGITIVPRTAAPTTTVSAAVITNQEVSIIDSDRHGPVIKLLSEVPDGHPVNCDLPTFNALLSETHPTERLSVSVPLANAYWTLIKHGGNVYVRGWMPFPMSRKAMTVQNLVLFNSPQAPELLTAHPTSVELRLDHFAGQIVGGEYNGDGSQWCAIRASHVEPDELASAE